MCQVLVVMTVATLQLNVWRGRLHLLLCFELVRRNDLPWEDGVADRAVLLDVALADLR